jgi:hypothetical protein
LRWKIWDDSRIEPWYRQNLFLARRAVDIAGLEPRIRSVVHPDIWNRVIEESYPTFEDYIHQIEQGRMSVVWNLTLPARALWAKLERKLK